MAIPDIDWDRVYVSNFTMKLLTSREWFSTANELIAAAEVLSPHVIAWWDSLMEWSKGQGIFLEHGHHSTFLMLYAFAMENLCKGYLVSRFSFEEREAIRTSGKLPNELKTHDLRKLVESVGLNLDLTDEDMLRRLERASVWGGRYPIPDSYSKERPQKYSDGKEYSTALLGRADLERVRTLAQRIREHVGAPESYRINAQGNG